MKSSQLDPISKKPTISFGLSKYVKIFFLYMHMFYCIYLSLLFCQLSNPTSGWSVKKIKHFVDGGDSGNREAKINNLIQRML